MSAPSAPSPPTGPATPPTKAALQKKSWFHLRPMLIGLFIVLLLGGLVYYLYHVVTHKNLLAKWPGASN